MEYTFKSAVHLYNSSLKVLRDNGLNFGPESKKTLLGFSEMIYDFENENMDDFISMELILLSKKWIYDLKSCFDSEDVVKALKFNHSLKNDYEDFINGNLPDDKEWFLSNCIKDTQIIKTVWNKDKKAYLDVTDEFSDLVETLKNKMGIYKLYDGNKKLIYVGKSTKNLGSRLSSSCRERQAIYADYCEFNNEADLNIYEMYLIAALDPPLNSDGKTKKKPSIKLKELEYSNIVKILEV